MAAPVAEHVHTRSRATWNGNRYPERIVRKIEPGMAKDCKKQ